MTLVEAQIDRLVGPTHHFGGLGVGNLASQEHHGKISNPRAAALQGLDKMALVASLGAPQFILPPQQRDRLGLLRRMGFAGEDRDVLQSAFKHAPEVLSAVMSSSAMWTANAATVAAATDNGAAKLTLVVANLEASLHRSFEPEQTLVELGCCLPVGSRLVPALSGGFAMRDEGAANHMRLGIDGPTPGVHLFVFGDGIPSPERFDARQAAQASRALARCLGVSAGDTFFLKQHPRAIDAGAFHNDVVAASHGHVLLHHESAFMDADETLTRVDQRLSDLTGRPLQRVVVSDLDLPLVDAVQTYLFNSQIIDADTTAPPILICPAEVERHDGARQIVEAWRDREQLFSQVHYVELGQSMHAGGGPACLRLRVPVRPDELSQFRPSTRWTPESDQAIRAIVERDYPTAVTLESLAELDLVRPLESAEQELRALLLGSAD